MKPIIKTQNHGGVIIVDNSPDSTLRKIAFTIAVEGSGVYAVSWTSESPSKISLSNMTGPEAPIIYSKSNSKRDIYNALLDAGYELYAFDDLEEYGEYLAKLGREEGMKLKS